MKPKTPQTIGYLMVGISAISLLVSLILLIQVWRLRQPLTAELLAFTRSTSDVLTSTSSGLDTVQKALDNAKSSVTQMKTITVSAGETITNGAALTDATYDLLAIDLANVITATQVNLTSAQTGTELIENTLIGIGQSPLFSSFQYPADKPLTTSLANLSTSLVMLPDAIHLASTKLASTQKTLVKFKEPISKLSLEIDNFSLRLDESKSVVTSYQETVDDLQARLATIQRRIPGVIQAASWILTLLIAWIGTAQVDLLLRGWERIHPTESNT